MRKRTYICIDLKSFYASVECVERGLDPMTTNLVVADPERSDKTICLAITPSMKKLGISNRCRIFEIPKNIDYIVATPRMQKYIDYSAEIYAIYLKYISKEDIHVYSIDEAFLDITDYLEIYKLSAKEMAMMFMDEILKEVGVRATCGIGTNLYLAKIALDITAKHSPDFIGILNEQSYRETLWEHTPLTDFWRIGKGISRTLERYGIVTMRQIAEMDELFLYRLFGVDAELLIDHAWGREPVTIQDIKSYKPKVNCISSGQVLMRDYNFEEGLLIVKEMMDLLSLELVSRNLMADSVSLYVGYSNNLKREPARGSYKLESRSSSDKVLILAIISLYERIVDQNIPVRRVSITCNHVNNDEPLEFLQVSMFDDGTKEMENERIKKIQQSVLDIKKKFGKNAILKGMNYMDSATTRDRNRQIGGHKSGE